MLLLFSCSVMSNSLRLHGLQRLGFSDLYHLPEFAQTHVHWIHDAIQSSHPLYPPSPFAFNFSQHQDLLQWVSALHQAAKESGFPDGSDGKESAYNAGDPGSIPGSGRLPREGMAIHSSILAWRIPWIEEPGGLESMRSQRVRHDWATNIHTHTYTGLLLSTNKTEFLFWELL